MFTTLSPYKKFQYIPTNKERAEREENITPHLFWTVSKKEKIKEDWEDDFFNYIHKLRRHATKSIDVSINGSNLKFPYNLRHIADSIIESKYLLDLEEDWDEEGANATNFETYKIAIDFLVNYSKEILNTYDSILGKPFIDITRDGSISMEWNTHNGSFFIIFKKANKEYAYYYGQEKQTNIPFKYRVKLNEPIELITLTWMSQYLT